MNLNNNPWPDERVEALKKLWAAGLSATQIAAELTGPPFQEYPSLSRNSAIGKIHRLGLSGRTKGHAPPKKRKVRRQVGQNQFAAKVTRSPTRAAAALALEPDGETLIDHGPDVVSAHDNVIPMTQRLTLLELNDDTCKWPVGEPQSPDFFFCGGISLAGLPYCAVHTRVAKAPHYIPKRYRVEGV